jgi:hypothetical protein
LACKKCVLNAGKIPGDLAERERGTRSPDSRSFPCVARRRECIEKGENNEGQRRVSRKARCEGGEDPTMRTLQSAGEVTW